MGGAVQGSCIRGYFQYRGGAVPGLFSTVEVQYRGVQYRGGAVHGKFSAEEMQCWGGAVQGRFNGREL